MAGYSVVELLNGAGSDLDVARLAGHVWPLAQHHLDALAPGARDAVEHYRDHLPSCQTYTEQDGCEGCRPATPSRVPTTERGEQ